MASAEQLHGPTANLANTRALVVEPMLNALGWDTTNLDHVARDWPLSGSHSISYALRVSDQSALFVQTTPIDVSVDDGDLVDDTLDRVAGADTGWCLITNGLHYRVFKADEAVARENRLLFELELANVAANPHSDAANDLELLTRESLMNGSLEMRGEQFYIDPRVRQALLDLCRDPSSSFLDAMEESIAGPTVPVDRVRASLARSVDRGRRRGGQTTPFLASDSSVARPRTSSAQAKPAVPDSAEVSAEPDPGQTATVAPASPDDGAKPKAATKAQAAGDIVGTALAERREDLSEDALGAAKPSEIAVGTALAEPPVGLSEGSTVAVAVAVELETDEERVDADIVAPEQEPVEETTVNTHFTAESESAEPESPWNEPRHNRFGAGRAEHALVDHLSGKPGELIEIFEDLDRYARSLGEDTTRRVRKRSVDYSRGRRSWFSLEIREDAIRLMVSLDPAVIESWAAQQARRAPIAVGPGLFGESEYTLTKPTQLDDGHDLLRLAYDALGAPSSAS